MTHPTCLDCGKVVDVRAGYHDCPGSKAVPDIHGGDDRDGARCCPGCTCNACKSQDRYWEGFAAGQQAIERAGDADDLVGQQLDEARSWIAAAQEELVQRDRRIAELEVVLRIIASGNPASPGKWLSDVQMADIARAALFAPAQSATAAPRHSGEEDCGCFACPRAACYDAADAAPPSPAQPATAQKPRPLLDAEGERVVAGLAQRWEEFKADRRACPECGTTNRVHDEKCSLRDPAEAAPPSPAARDATMTCRAIEVTGQHCKVPIERDELWCGYHRGVAPEPMPDDDDRVISSNQREAVNLAAVRSVLVAASERLYLSRKRCNCWGKMEGSCPTCKQTHIVEDGISDALDDVATARSKETK